MTNDVFHLEWLLSLALFVGVRVSGLMVFAPFLAGSAIPMRVKAGLTIALTALLSFVPRPASLPSSPFELAGIVIGEFMVGLFLGIMVSFVMDSVQFAGQVLGVQLGFSLVNIMDPQTQVDTPVLSIFHELVTLLLFLQMNVHHWLLRGLGRSFAYLPGGAGISTVASTELLLRAAGGIFLVGVQIAAPALLATLIADIMLGFLGKASPNLPVLFVGLSVKSLLGLVVIVVALAAWPRVLEKHFTEAIASGERLLQLAK